MYKKSKVFKIEAVINGLFCNLTNIKEYGPMEKDLNILKIIIREYVAKEFDDIVHSLNDITSIKLLTGTKLLYHFIY